MSDRYEWREIDNGYGPHAVVWDNIENTHLNFLPGDVVKLLNAIHEQSVIIEELTACLKVEQ